MGQHYTTVTFEFGRIVQSPEIFDKIDLCLEKIQYLGLENGVTVKLGDDFKRGLTLADRKKFASSVHYMDWCYDALQEPGSTQTQKQFGGREPYTVIELVWSRAAGPTALCITLMAPLEHRPAYTRREMELAKKIERVSLCLHETLGAIRTSGREENMEEDWFYFSKEQSKPMGELLHWEEEDEEE